MRIIAGDKRGTILNAPEGEQTRPTYDRVKEAVFGRLQFSLVDKTVLDLFAGSGALGLEAVSRGAKMAYFCDFSKEAVKVIKSNIKKLGYEEKCAVFKNDYLGAIKEFSGKIKFDIVFIDPPYASGYYIPALEALKESGILADGCILAMESDKNFEINISGYTKTKEKKYGITYINYLEYSDE